MLLMLENKPCFHITFLNWEELGKCSIIEYAYIFYLGRWRFLLAKSDTVIQPSNNSPIIFYLKSECAEGTGDSGCGTRRDFRSTCGAISVTVGPDGSTNFCSFSISVPEGMRVNLTFADFHIQDTGIYVTYFSCITQMIYGSISKRRVFSITFSIHFGH